MRRHLLLIAGASLVIATNSASAPTQDQVAGEETLIIPTEANAYFKPDIRFRLRMPRAFLHQHGGSWKPPIRAFVFKIDLRNNGSTEVSPIEDPAVVSVYVSVVPYDAIEAGLNPQSRRFMPIRGLRLDGDFPEKFGLSYIGNIAYPGGPVEHTLFRGKPDYNLVIACRPSGNAHPSLCTLSAIGERGGGLLPQGNAAIETNITFRQERLADWATIQQQVESFLDNRLTVMTWSDEPHQ